MSGSSVGGGGLQVRLTIFAALGLAAITGAGAGWRAVGWRASRRPSPPGPVEGEMTIAQWPLDVDPGEDGTVAEFERDTGVEVSWDEEINDNQEFFAKIQPELPRANRGAAA